MDDDRVINGFKRVHMNTKRRILPLENHSSKYSREKRRSEGGWEERREKGKREEEGEEEQEGKGGRV